MTETTEKKQDKPAAYAYQVECVITMLAPIVHQSSFYTEDAMSEEEAKAEFLQYTQEQGINVVKIIEFKRDEKNDLSEIPLEVMPAASKELN